MLLTAIDSEQATPSLSQAQRMKKLSRDGKLNDDTMLDIMMEQKKPEGYNVVLSADKLRKYFPRSYTPQRMEETILKLLDAWLRKHQREQQISPYGLPMLAGWLVAKLHVLRYMLRDWIYG